MTDMNNTKHEQENTKSDLPAVIDESGDDDEEVERIRVSPLLYENQPYLEGGNLLIIKDDHECKSKDMEESQYEYSIEILPNIFTKCYQLIYNCNKCMQNASGTLQC